MRIELISLSLVIILAGLGFSSCNDKTLFVELSPSETGLDFSNTITETSENNIMTYQYLYNGAGIAAGDINGDGLPDLYVCGNSSPNKLYINKGKWKFEDITKVSGAKDRIGDWKTGVTMADVNGDGFLDIYVCYSGNTAGEGFGKPVIRNNEHRSNQLFINQGCKPGGTPILFEQAALFGLDAAGTFSTQAYFFDYDRDGDLDMFLLNHANTFYTPFFNTSKLRSTRHPYFGNRMYRNDNMKFVDVTDSTGIYGSGLNFGLGAAISDLDNDGWPDIYVTNDYDEQDFCYLNNRNGTFSEISHKAMGHLSKFGMGVDIADVNNDMKTDIFVADMLPEDNYRQKILKGADQYDKYSLLVDSGFHHQTMRNTFQLNAGIGPDGVPVFSEVGQLAGISNTDWSWGPLFADFDNDGWKDLFITNGYLHDYTNLDFLKFADDVARDKSDGSYDVMSVIRQMPSTKIKPYAFRNKGGWQFENTTHSWGFSEKSISNAVVYADFDNDGDLDLIMNRLNDGLAVYKNQCEQFDNAHYIKIKLNGSGSNRFGIGAKVWVRTDSATIFQEAFYTKGYESSVEPVMTIGLGKNDLVKEIKVQWVDGNFTTLKDIAANQTIVIDQKNNAKETEQTHPVTSVLTDYTAASGIDFVHRENNFVDFKVQRLLPYQLSRLGGKMAMGDVNNDGNDDVFFCGASGQASKLYLSNDDGHFIAAASQPWTADAVCEDMSAAFFDADKDGDQDLYVVSGGNEFEAGDSNYHDRLYINAGNGKFEKAVHILPDAEKSSGSCVVPCDYDKDGDMDIFVGGRLSVKNYPVTPESFLLRNDYTNGQVQFTNVTAVSSKELQSAGMITDAAWIDVNNDGWKDLIVSGEWMSVKIFKNNNGKTFTDISFESGIAQNSGLWSRIATEDFDGDGDVDIVAANAGINMQYMASFKEPMQYFIQDLNNDGVIDPIICYYNNGQNYPVPTLDELIDQVPSLRKIFFKYEDYAKAGINDIIGQKNIGNSSVLNVTTLKSTFFKNNGDGKFEAISLPDNFQSSMLQAFVYDDFDRDKRPEILCAGNFYPYKVEQGRSDSFFGGLLECSANGINEKKLKEPLWLMGDIRDMASVKSKSGKRIIVVSRNNDKASVYYY